MTTTELSRAPEREAGDLELLKELRDALEPFAESGNGLAVSDRGIGHRTAKFGHKETVHEIIFPPETFHMFLTARQAFIRLTHTLNLRIEATP